MRKTEIIETYWEEYLNDFVKPLIKQQKEKEVNSPDLSKDFLGIMLDPVKFAQEEVLTNLSRINEENFWTWYAVLRDKVKEKSDE